MKKVLALAVVASLLAPNAFAVESMARATTTPAPVLPTPAIGAIQAVNAVQLQPNVEQAKLELAPQTALGAVQFVAAAKPEAAEPTAQAVFDGGKIEAKSPAPAVLGAFSAGAMALAPATAHAAPTSLSQHAADPVTWVILGGAVVAGGIIGMTVTTVKNVARTLDDEPTESELARYKRSERVLNLGRARDAGFTGDRISMVSSRASFELEIRELTGMDDATQAILEAGAYSEKFRYHYAAHAHPWIAAVVRWWRGEQDPEIRALEKRAGELRRFQAMSGVYFKDAPLPADEFERVANELRTIEARLASLRANRR